MQFTRRELLDVINAIDVMTGSYTEELEVPMRELYRHDTVGFHRLRAVQHKLQAALNEVDEPA